MADVELTEERHPLASSEADRKDFVKTFKEGADTSQFVKRPLLRRTLIAATVPLGLAPLVLFRDLGPSARHLAAAHGVAERAAAHHRGQQRPLKPADFDTPGRDDHRDPGGLPEQRRRDRQGSGDHHQARAGRTEATRPT